MKTLLSEARSASNVIRKFAMSRKNHLTLKTHCKNKEFIYCISGRNASEKELDLQIN